MTVIDDIKQKLDIVELVSGYVPLQKAGRNFRALCPFHAEKTPSFYVFPERQTWHCFGSCGTGGDVFTFLMRKENLDFAAALRLLAQRSGIPLPAGPRADREGEAKREPLYQVNEAAALYYHHQLQSAPAAQGCRQYVEQRGLAASTVASFQLGFAPPGGQALLSHLHGRGYSPDHLLAAGLVVKNDRGEIHDRFQGHLLFPIHNPQGRVAGFGGRALGDALPKYLNTPQTEIFDKGGLLYGLDRARAAIRHLGYAIIAEGYTDVLHAHQAGFEQVVASMGTALTEKQLVLLKKLTPNLVLAMDADAAGAQATLRAQEVAARALEQKGVPVLTPRGVVKYENVLDAEIKVLLLPSGKDPDDVIRESPSAWQQLVDQAQPLLEYILNSVVSEKDLTQPREKSAAVRQMLPILAEVKDAVRRAHYLQRLARLVGMEERTLAAGLRRQSSSLRRSDEEDQTSLYPVKEEGLEDYCLALLWQYPELRDRGEKLSPEYFESAENRELFLAWQQSPQAPTLPPEVEAILQPRLDGLRSKPLPPTTPGERERNFLDAMRRLKEKTLLRWLRRQEEALLSQSGDLPAQLAQLQEQGLELDEELKRVEWKPQVKKRN